MTVSSGSDIEWPTSLRARSAGPCEAARQPPQKPAAPTADRTGRGARTPGRGPTKPGHRPTNTAIRRPAEQRRVGRTCQSREIGAMQFRDPHPRPGLSGHQARRAGPCQPGQRLATPGPMPPAPPPPPAPRRRGPFARPQSTAQQTRSPCEVRAYSSPPPPLSPCRGLRAGHPLRMMPEGRQFPWRTSLEDSGERRLGPCKLPRRFERGARQNSAGPQDWE